MSMFFLFLSSIVETWVFVHFIYRVQVCPLTLDKSVFFKQAFSEKFQKLEIRAESLEVY